MRRHLWWLAGLAMAVVGLVLVLSSRTASSEFGWFAYTPATEPAWSMDGDDSGVTTLFVSSWQMVGAAVGGFGLLVMALGLGYRIGRRSGRSD